MYGKIRISTLAKNNGVLSKDIIEIIQTTDMLNLAGNVRSASSNVTLTPDNEVYIQTVLARARLR